jgi:hypothetical protein
MNEKRKRQLEKNRLSARESRQKKKAYIQQLEAQVINSLENRIKS